MFLAHSFRLRDPWQCEPAEGGGLRWSRVFHRPTGLEPDDSLVLVISGLPLRAQVTINGHAFAPRGQESFQFDLTSILADANRIEIHLPAARGLAPPAAFPYDARLGVIARS